jgi:CHAD domain-containing protein
MFARHPGPAVLLAYNLNQLLQHLPGVRDGFEDSIHHARVAIRRVREPLALTGRRRDDEELDRIASRLKRGSRTLGRSRDADIAQRLVQHVESLFPLAPTVVARLKAAVAGDQLATRRKAVKRLERLNLELLPQQLRGMKAVTELMRASRWKPSLRHQVASRAEAVRAAVNHATGVYLPNRAHTARIAIKRLRYTLELAEVTGTWRASGALRELNKAQKALGEAHDREVLVDRLNALIAAGAELPRAEIDALEQFVRSEALAWHGKYLGRRDDILAICAQCPSESSRPQLASRALLVAAAGVPSLLLLRRGVHQ